MADGFDFNLYQQQQANSASNGKPALGCLGFILPVNLQDTQGPLWGKNLNMPSWMDATMPGIASMYKAGQLTGIAGIMQKMSEQLSQMNKDGLAQLSQGGQGLVAPLPTPGSGSAASGPSDFEIV